jgi:hypothetical protein
VDSRPQCRGPGIFPAAGYIAVAIGAVSRIRGIHDSSLAEPTTFEFRNVCINSAMVVTEDHLRLPVEIHTIMSLRRLSAKAFSASIYDFAISSWSGGQSVVHCTGSAKVFGSSFKKTVLIPDNDPLGTGPWTDGARASTKKGCSLDPTSNH